MAPEAEAFRRESPAINTGRVVALTGGFLALVIVMGGLLALYYRSILQNERLTAPVRDFPAPQLEPNPAQDYKDVRAAQERQLEDYAWVDRNKGLIHVPIDRAMAIVAARGARAYDPVDGTPPFNGTAPADGAPRAQPHPQVAPFGVVR